MNFYFLSLLMLKGVNWTNEHTSAFHLCFVLFCFTNLTEVL